MPHYTFTGPSGKVTEVTASSEAEARDLAMASRHTPAQMSAIGATIRPYLGAGLFLLEQKD